jgi:hypothetical protein
MKLDLKNKVVHLLKQHPEQKFTARQIAEWVFTTYPNECAAKRKRSKATVEPLVDDYTLLQQLVAEIGSVRHLIQKRCPYIKTTEERPRKYYYTEKTDQMEVEAAEAEGSKAVGSGKVYERDLYPILSEFLWAEYGIYSKRIDEKRSSNNRGYGGNKWLYPDLVAMEDLTDGWDQAVKTCVQQYADKKTTLWSFEVKLLVNSSNVRQSFFQAVSNSSWANYGYLVAGELEGTDTKHELQILSSLHGIGFILLDTKTPADSQVLIPAREKADIDWDTANRIVDENRDFKDFIEEVTAFHQTGKTKPSDWDKVDD